MGHRDRDRAQIWDTGTGMGTQGRGHRDRDGALGHRDRDRDRDKDRHSPTLQCPGHQGHPSPGRAGIPVTSTSSGPRVILREMG